MTMSSASSPRWNTSTKFLVALVVIVMLGALLYRFQVILPPLILALMLTYLLNPVVGFLRRQTGLSWGGSVNMTFLLLVLFLGLSTTALGFALEQQAEGLYETVVEILTHLPEYLNRWTSAPLGIGPFAVDLSRFELEPLVREAIGSVQAVLGRTGTLLAAFFSRAFSMLGWAMFVLVVSYYLLHDFHTLGPSFDRMAVPGYSADAQRLRHELGVIWNAFLRGQLVLAVAMAVASAVLMGILGVRYSLMLGLLFGLTEFIPIVGPLIAGLVAVGVAFFQDANWLGLTPLAYAGVVALAAVLLQQLENNLLVPRILGRTLNLHPVLIMIGAIVGASLAGVLGLLLSAPMVATARLLGRYAYRKMLDLPPFNEPAQPSASTGSPVRRFGREAGEDLEPEDSPGPLVETHPAANSGAPRILLIDDDPDILELLELSLKRAGHDVVAARNGDEALRVLSDANPGLILLDLMMPGIDGYETLRDLRRRSDAPVMVVSALSDSREVTKALESGAVDFLPKPFHPAELVSRVNAVLGKMKQAEARE